MIIITNITDIQLSNLSVEQASVGINYIGYPAFLPYPLIYGFVIYSSIYLSIFLFLFLYLCLFIFTFLGYYQSTPSISIVSYQVFSAYS